MSVNEEDEMMGDVDRIVRTGVMAAGQIAERRARMGGERDRFAFDRQRAAVADYERRFVADRDVARAYHRQVADPSFWEKASPQRVAQTFAAAYQWREHDGEAAVALARFKEGMAEHHGVDVDRVLAGELKVEGPLRENDPLAEVRHDPARRDYAEYVLGRFTQGAAGAETDDAVAAAEKSTGRDARRDVDEVAQNASADQDRVAGEDAAARGRTRRGAGATTEPKIDRFDYEPLPPVGDDWPTEPPSVPATSEQPEVTAAAAPVPGQRARDEAAQNFPTSAAQSLRASHPAARARVVRGPVSESDRSRDLGL